MSRNILFFVLAVVLAGVGVLALRSPTSPPMTDAHRSDEPPAHSRVNVEPAVIERAPIRSGSSPLATPPEPASSEADLMVQLRALLDKGAPQSILDLAHDIEQRYPSGREAEERSLYIIDSLIALDRLPEMRDEARRHLSKWPNTPISERVMARTGVHPEPTPLQ